MGKRVEAHYRVADIHQKSVGTLVADTGLSIVVEERLLDGERKPCAWKSHTNMRLTETPRNSDEPITVHSVPPKVRR